VQEGKKNRKHGAEAPFIRCIFRKAGALRFLRKSKTLRFGSK
jgi:hypothetical protein